MHVEVLSQLGIAIITENGHKFTMTIPFGAPYSDAYVALDQFKNTIDQMQKNAQDRALEQAAQEPKKEE